MSYDASLLIELGDSKILFGFLGDSTPLGSILCNNTNEIYTNNQIEFSEYLSSLCSFWDSIFLHHFKVKPKGKTVYLIRPTFVSDYFINQTLNILFNNFGVVEIHLQPHCVLPLLSFGHSSGIVIDISANTIFIYSIVHGVCDLFHSIFLKHGSLQYQNEKLLEEAREGELNVIDSLLQLIMELSWDCRKYAVTKIIVYDHEGSSTNSSLRNYLIHKLCHQIETNQVNKSLVPCLPLLRQQQEEENEYIYWRGYGVGSHSKVKDECITEDQWKDGKRWKDPLVQIL